MREESKQLDLFDQLTLNEGVDVEYKSAKGGLPQSLWSTYSAFANSEGGTIWLGIAERDGRLIRHGVDDPQRLVRDFWSAIHSKGKVSKNLLKDVDVSIIEPTSPLGALVRINVPRATRTERPVYIGSDPMRGTYRRNHEGDYHCTESEVRRMFADQSEETADSRVLEDFTIDDLDPESLAQFRNRFRSREPGHPWLTYDDHGLLEKLGGLQKNRKTGQVQLTVAGLLMFGKTEAITAPGAIPGFHVDYRERLSDNPGERWSDRLTSDGMWEANLFQFYQRVIVKLTTGPGIKQPFQIDAEGYRRTSTPVHEALQEALVNALIHADHGGQGGIVIDRFPDRFELSNPGTLLISREQLLRGGISECRNKFLQRTFQMLGVGDKAGSGIDRIRSSWAGQHWQSPQLRETLRPDRVMLVLPMISTLPGEIMERLGERFGDAFRQCEKEEVQALVAAEVEGEITNQRLQEMLALHRVDITRMLRRLVESGLLVVEGVGRGTRYFPVRESMESAADESTSARLPTSPSILPESSSILEATPSILEATPSILEATPSILPESSSILESELGEHLPELVALALEVRKTGRTDVEKMRRTILSLCNGRFLNLRQLSELLDRKPDTVRNVYLTKMVREGLLELRYPGTPSHRNQAYLTRTTGSEEGMK